MSHEASIPPAVLDSLMREGGAAWDDFRIEAEGRGHLFIPSDYAEVYAALLPLRGECSSFIELGSGPGIITIMASLMGFDAYGIELEPWLVQRASDLAEQFGACATFVAGSFVHPDQPRAAEFQAGREYAFDELGLELADFDLIFAYPWPEEADAWEHWIRSHARPGASLLVYDSSQGCSLSRVR